jgi:aspartate aminotransferase
LTSSNNSSNKINALRKKDSPIKEIMNFSDPEYIATFGINVQDVISFAGGWSNHSAPEELRKAYETIITNPELFHKSGSYSTSIGDREFRNSLCKFENYLYNMEITEKQISVGLGSTQLTNDLFTLLLESGDKVLLLDPSYSNYPEQLENNFSNIDILRFSVIDEEKWEYVADKKIEEFSNYILENKPKIVLLVSPDNPTSKILSQNFIQKTLDSVKKVDGYLLIDFAYKELVFDKNIPEYFSWGPTENFIAIRTNSKWCRSLGRRIGWIEAEESIIESLELIQSSTILSPDQLHQMAFQKFITESIENDTLNDYLEKTQKLYKNISEKTNEIIKKYLKLPTIKPDGGLYIFMKINSDSATFVKDILKNTGVFFIPGWGFGKTGNNAVRISLGPLVNNPDVIEKGIIKVAKYLEK